LSKLFPEFPQIAIGVVSVEEMLQGRLAQPA